jgi:hypothetical protein
MWAHGGLGSNVKTRMNEIPCALTSPIDPLEVYLDHGHYPPTTQTRVEGLKI